LLIKEIKAIAKEYSSRGLTVRNLINGFGFQKRSEKNLEEINLRFKENELYCLPPLSMKLDLNDRIHIYNFPVLRSHDFFEKEALLEKHFIDHKLYEKPPFDLGYKGSQNRPKESRDRFDVVCADKDGTTVIIELKRADGGKSAVEQVLRYMGMEKQGKPTQPVRGILITGVKDIHTAKAIYGMNEEQRKSFEWYMYQYDGKDLSFEPISIKEIVAHFENPVA
ncbi:MAG: DUF91 domain-containing protein, partial [Chitinophagaceae bacterium]